METITFLKWTAIGLPLVAALLIRVARGMSSRTMQRVTFLVLCLVALTSLGLFFTRGNAACMFAGGEQNCLFDGLAALSLSALAAYLAFATFVQRSVQERIDYALVLLLTGAWAGLGLAENLFELIVFMNLLFYVLFRLFKRKDIVWGFVVPRSPPQDR